MADAAHHRRQLAKQLLDPGRVVLDDAEHRGGVAQIVVGVVDGGRRLGECAVQLLGRATAERLVEDRHHPVLLDDRPLEVFFARGKRRHHVVPVGQHGPEVRMPRSQCLHDLAQVGDERVEVVGIAGERVGQGLEVQGERRQVARGRVHVLAPPGGSLAQGVDHQVQLVADLGIEGVQNLVDFDRGQGVVLVDGAAVRDPALSRGPTIDLHIRLTEQVFLPDHGPCVVEEGCEVAVEQHAHPGRAGDGGERLDLADPQPRHRYVIARHQVGAGFEDGVHPIASKDEFTAHLQRQDRHGEQADKHVGDEHRQVGPAPHFAPPRSTPTTASKASGTLSNPPTLPAGSLQGATLQPPVTTVIRVAYP